MDELASYRFALIALYRETGEEIERVAGSLIVEGRDSFFDTEDQSASQIFSHIRDVEVRYFLPFMVRILAGEQEELGIFEDVENSHHDGARAEGLQEIISDLQDSHGSLTAMLEEMSPQDWNRPGRHRRSGMHTLQWYLEQNLVHLIEHLNQLSS